ncbi:MAG: hypothetical protein IIV10_00065, partial [Alistipes sp.]|nr:hypothetical protein [Alistipes sp.]
ILAVVLLGLGWYMPDFLEAALKEKERLEAEAAAKSNQTVSLEEKSTVEQDGPVLTDEDGVRSAIIVKIFFIFSLF